MAHRDQELNLNDVEINHILANWSKSEERKREAELEDAVRRLERKIKADQVKERQYTLELARKGWEAEVWARMPQLAKREHTPKAHAHRAQGGGADCMFDYLISECWDGVEGMVMQSITGCDFRVYSTIQGAVDHAETLADDRIFFICGGEYAEEVTMPTGMDSTTRWKFFGAGKYRTIINAPGSSGVALTLDDDGGGVWFQDMTLEGGVTGYSVLGTVSNLSVFFTECLFENKVTADFANASFIRCDFDGGYQVESGFSPQTVQFIDCNFTGLSTWTGTVDQHYFANCRWAGTNDRIVSTGGLDEIVFDNCTFDTSGAAKTAFTVNGGSVHGLIFDGCQFGYPSTAGTGNVYFQSVTDMSGCTIDGCEFDHNSGRTDPYIVSADAQTEGVSIVGNNFHKATDGDYVEDDGGVSISGLFTDSVFGPNTPPNFDINITAGSNNLYIGTRTTVTGSTGTTLVPGGSAVSTGTYVVATDQDATLPNSRLLTAGTNIDITDGGAAGNITIDVDLTETPHNLLAAEHGDTVASTRTRGDLIVGTATGWDDLAINAVNGALLASDGTDVLWRTILTEPVTAKTIASDQIAVTQGTDTSHLTLAGEGAAADDLDGITGGSDGMILIASAVSDSVTITVKHNNAGGSSGAKIFTAGGTDISLDDIQDICVFIYKTALDSGNGGWMAGMIGGGGGATALLDGVSHTDTTNSAVTRGDLIYGNSTPAWDDLALGSEGQFLRASSTDVTWANPEIRGYLTDLSDGAAKGMMRFNRATGTMFTTLAITSLVAPTFTHVFTFRKNGTSVGTVSLGAATRATSTVSAFGFAAGDLLTIDHDADSGGHALDEGGEIEWSIY